MSYPDLAEETLNWGSYIADILGCGGCVGGGDEEVMVAGFFVGGY